MTRPTDAEIDQAMARGEALARRAIRALAVCYDAERDDVILSLSDGETLTIARSLIQGLGEASKEDVSAVELLGDGSGLHWERLDMDFTVAGLVAGIFGNRSWMERLGHQGGDKE